jgi:hypothetical protein
MHKTMMRYSTRSSTQGLPETRFLLTGLPCRCLKPRPATRSLVADL